MDPYNWPFPQKNETMYLSNISSNDLPYASKTFMRESTFQSKDIFGAQSKNLVSPKKVDSGYSLSTFVQPKPQINRVRTHVSDPLKLDDIQGSRPKANQFRTRRIVDPLAPKYQLASCAAFSVDQGRKFLRDPLEIQDIAPPKKKYYGGLVARDPITGSTPMARTKDLNAISRLQVKDINKDGIFESTRHTNPLIPNYEWRDDENDKQKVNMGYGQIQGMHPRVLHPHQVRRKNDMSLNNKDIQGSSAGSFFQRSHFLDKRREFRNYMNNRDIQKTDPSSLKKGIVTNRQLNPLMPNYQFPGHTQVK